MTGRPLLILVLENRQIIKDIARTEVDSSRRKAWAFTRLSNIGVCRYLKNVSEVICSRFSVCIISNKSYNNHE